MSGLRTTTPATLVVTAAVSAPLGGAISPLAVLLGRPVPQVPWLTVAGPWFLAVFVGIAAWGTWRTLGGEPPWRRTPVRDPGGREHEPRPRRAGAGGGSPSRRVGAGGGLEPHQAVNRLVLGKAAALVGAICAGAYVGFAVVALGGVERQLDGERVLNSLVAAVGGLALVLAGVLLERACRTQDPDEADLA